MDKALGILGLAPYEPPQLAATQLNVSAIEVGDGCDGCDGCNGCRACFKCSS